ncbi:hypothetical protein ABW20_dc0103086 [Dactylellina cionopaga]|nr:hypothetical protein ABW20_dc0103086 [Dactylellina cionopaga]
MLEGFIFEPIFPEQTPSGLNFPPNAGKTRFSINEGWHANADRFNEIDQAAIREIYDELIKTPLVSTAHPSMARCHAWVTKILSSTPSWQNFFSCRITTVLYRIITPDEFQTPEHMRIVYILCVVGELLMRLTIPADDLLDGTNIREDQPAWWRLYPRSMVADQLVWREMATWVFDLHIPIDHPQHAVLKRISENFVRLASFYFTFPSSIQGDREDMRREQGGSAPLNGGKTLAPLALFSNETLAHVNTLRSFQFVRYFADLARFAACYDSVPSQPFYELFDYGANIFVHVDDIMEELYDQSDPNCHVDIMTGEIMSLPVYLMDNIEELASGAGITVQEVRDTMERNFGTQKLEDAKRVKELYRKLKLTEYVNKLIIKMWERLLESEAAAQEKIGLRGGILSNVLILQIESDIIVPTKLLEGVKKMKAMGMSDNDIMGKVLEMLV